MQSAPIQRGLTLIELVVVVAILAILAVGVVPLINQYAGNARQTAVKASLVEIRNAIVGTPDTPGYLSDMGQLPTTVNDLFVNPFPLGNPLATFDRTTGLGWRGPYLVHHGGNYAVDNSRNFTTDYGNNGDPALIDPWGNAIILQRPTLATAGSVTQQNLYARLISAGPNGVLDTPQDYAGTPYPPAAARGDDILLFINRPDAP